jgi:hypothetical protein
VECVEPYVRALTPLVEGVVKLNVDVGFSVPSGEGILRLVLCKHEGSLILEVKPFGIAMHLAY